MRGQRPNQLIPLPNSTNKPRIIPIKIISFISVIDYAFQAKFDLIFPVQAILSNNILTCHETILINKPLSIPPYRHQIIKAIAS